ncbi:MAG: glycosyltransferase family 4 protein, partial [Cyanobacteria bacterium REEB459]|nr:glycosyltransferase family 4 protein [Cyanobacteria bacterium REEB459]
RVIVVSELFYPEEMSTAYIMTCIADHISEDNEVLVITGAEFYTGKNRKSSLNKLNTNRFSVRRVFIPKLSKDKLISRTLRLAILSVSLAITTMTHLKSEDILFSVTNPAPLVIFLAIVKKIKKASYILLVHDVFPENAVASGVIRHDSLIFKVVRYIFNWAYKMPDLIIAIGRDMAEIIESKIDLDGKQKIKIIENWSDLSVVKPISRWKSRIPELGLEGKIVIQYAGNIGRAQGILDFVRSVRLVNNDCIHFLYVGRGAHHSELKEELNGTENASVLDAFRRNEQAIVLGSCDIALVILGKGMYGLGVPSKTYNIMASGKPILFLGPKNSEIYRLINDFDIGWTFDWGDLSLVNKFINSIKFSDLTNIQSKGIRARKVAERFYNKELAMKKFRESISMVGNSKILI